jgi:sporulation protein YlmC with PRC-barrel domain
MAEILAIDDIRRIEGREVLDANGEAVGYVDVVFVDETTRRPEWLGVWNGVWNTKPRVLVPVAGLRRDGDRVIVPWAKDLIEGAPGYDEEDSRGLFSDHSESLGVSGEKERIAYEHYGLRPPEAAAVYVARLRVLRIEELPVE